MINQEEKSNALKLARHAIENDDPTILLVRHHTGISEAYVLTDDEALAFDMLMSQSIQYILRSFGDGIDIDDIDMDELQNDLIDVINKQREKALKSREYNLFDKFFDSEAKMGITAIQQGTGDIEDPEKFKALPYPLQQLILEAIEDGKRRMKENGEEHED